MKRILFEQLPKELLEVHEALRKEIQDLKKIILEGGVDMSVSESDFSELKNRVSQVEERMENLSRQVNELSVDPEELSKAISDIKNITTTMEQFSSETRGLEVMITSSMNRILDIETEKATEILNGLSIPVSTASNIMLPTQDEHMNEISWESSKPSVINIDGRVYQPSASEGNTYVTLTATVRYGQAEVERSFVVNVLAATATNEEKLRVVMDSFDYYSFIGSAAEEGIYVSQNQVFTKEVDGVTIEWSTSNEGVIDKEGIVTRPIDGEEMVIVTAEFKFDGAAQSKEFIFFVEKAEEVVEPFDYKNVITGFDVVSSEQEMNIKTTFGGNRENLVGDEVFDIVLSLMNEEEGKEYNVTVRTDNEEVGSYTLTSEGLLAGVPLSVLLEQEKFKLSDYEEGQALEYILTFDSTEEKEIRVMLTVGLETIYDQPSVVNENIDEPTGETTE